MVYKLKAVVIRRDVNVFSAGSASLIKSFPHVMNAMGHRGDQQSVGRLAKLR